MRNVGRYLRATVVACASLIAVVLPVYVFVSSNLPESPPRLRVPVALALDQARQRALAIPTYTDGVPVLSYHEVSGRPKAISPRRFAAQMQLLDHEGFHPVTISELGAFLRSGRSLPQRPIVISFDQALGGLWRQVDPILERYNFRATAFMAPTTVDQHLPYNLSSGELKEMLASRRWDIEAALANVPDQRLGGRQLGQLLGSFERRRLPAPVAFLYPRGAAVSSAVSPRFPLSFQTGADPHFIGRGDSPYQQLPLFSVAPTLTPAELVGLLDAARPLAPNVSNALDSARGWRFEGGSYAQHSAEITLGWFRPSAPAAKHWLAAYYVPARTRDWHAYQATVEISSLGGVGSGADATVMVGSSPRLTLTLSANRLYARTTGSQEARTFQLAPDSRHLLQVSTAGGQAEVSVDGEPLTTLAAPVKGGIGIGVWRENDASPTPTFSMLTIAPPSGE